MVMPLGYIHAKNDKNLFEIKQVFVKLATDDRN